VHPQDGQDQRPSLEMASSDMGHLAVPAFNMIIESCARQGARRVTICVRVWSYQQVTAIRERDVGQGQTDSVEADELSNVYIANVLVDLRRNAKREGCPNRGNNIVPVR
jgi:hypothetical protein